MALIADLWGFFFTVVGSLFGFNPQNSLAHLIEMFFNLVMPLEE